LPETTTELYVVLYATGFRNLRSATATLGSSNGEILYAGPSQFPGVDQINIKVSRIDALVGRQLLTLTADGQSANTVELLFP